MWKLVMAECRYHWLLISTVYAVIALLAVCSLLFTGANWHVIMTTSSMALIIPANLLGASIIKEKRLRKSLYLPVLINKISIARLLAPACVMLVGLIIPWLIIVPFSKFSITPIMFGKTLLFFGFLFLVVTIHAFISDLKYLFEGPFGKLLYGLTVFLSYFVLMAMIFSVYLLYYSNISQAFGLENIQAYLSTSPGIFVFALSMVVVGVIVLMADMLVFQRRKTFLE